LTRTGASANVRPAEIAVPSIGHDTRDQGPLQEEFMRRFWILSIVALAFGSFPHAAFAQVAQA